MNKSTFYNRNVYNDNTLRMSVCANKNADQRGREKGNGCARLIGPAEHGNEYRRARGT